MKKADPGEPASELPTEAEILKLYPLEALKKALGEDCRVRAIKPQPEGKFYHTPAEGQVYKLGELKKKPEGKDLLLPLDLNGLVVIDLDCDDAAAPALAVLPETFMIGREGRPITKMIFKVDGVIAKKLSLMGCDQAGEPTLLLELLVDCNIALPGARHHKDHKQTLSQVGTAPVTPMKAPGLVEAVHMIAIVTQIGRFWPGKGQRQVATLATAGMFRRAGWPLEKAIEAVKFLNRDVSGTELQKRLDAVTATYKKAEGESFTGMKELVTKHLATHSAKARDSLFEVLKDLLKVGSSEAVDASQELEAVHELNKKHAVVPVGGKARILTKAIDPQTGQPGITFGTPYDLETFYRNRKIKAARGFKSVADVWLDHPQRRTYQGITFDPQATPEGFYNLFQGFSVMGKQGCCERYKALIRDIICAGNKELYQFVWPWMAHAVQKPWELPQTALVLRGGYGVGKGTFAHGFGHLFRPHFLYLSGHDQLVGRFNAHQATALLVFADEAVWGGDKRSEGLLKSMITEPVLAMEAKGQDIIQIRNFKRLIIASNESWAAPKGMGDRRFFVLDVPDVRKEDHPYFAAIHAELEAGGYEALMYELQKEDLTGFNPRKLPQTDNGFDMARLSANPTTKFWFECLRYGCNVAPPEYTLHDTDEDSQWHRFPVKQELHKLYLDWCKAQNIYRPATDSEFGLELRKITKLGGPKKLHGKRCYSLQSIKDCRAFFAKQFKVSDKIWDEVI